MKTNETTFLENITELKSRRYKAIWLEGETICDVEFGLTDKIKMDGNDYEWKYAILQDHLDELFKLNKGDDMFFNAERSDELKGVIKRMI